MKKQSDCFILRPIKTKFFRNEEKFLRIVEICLDVRLKWITLYFLTRNSDVPEITL